MRKLRMLVIMSAAIMAAVAARAEVSIIPQPSRVTERQGSYILPSKIVISYSDKSLEKAATYLQGIISPATGYQVSARKGLKGDIQLILKAAGEGLDEGYQLTSASGGITIKASSYKGIIHGISTLRQLLPYQIECKDRIRGVVWSVPMVDIEDTPSYEWRGLMLDPVRHFFSIEETKRFLDIMALYKFSKFHWHLTDSQAWRIEIKKYPKLTEESAWRDTAKVNIDVECEKRAIKEHNMAMHLPAEHFREVGGKARYGGYYTQDDIRGIVEYAAVRGIDIIPEVDMPGHNESAIRCYPFLGCSNDGQGPLCLGSDRTLEYAKDIFREIFSLFPYGFAEIGGDEVPRDRWASCPLCQKRIKDEHLSGLEELQSWFTREMEKFFNANGRRLIGWDEILEGGVSPTATVNWWQGYHADVVQRATSGGNEVICCPTDFCYLDYPQTAKTLSGLYHGAIVPAGLTPEQHKLVKGMQANIWTEFIPTEERMQYQVFPRALAVAERAWSEEGRQSWESFTKRLAVHLFRLETMDVTYRPLGEE